MSEESIIAGVSSEDSCMTPVVPVPKAVSIGRMTQLELNGVMLIVYQALEKMNREQRRFLLKSVKEARRILDFNYPEGKPQEKEPTIIIPTTEEKNAILGNDTSGC